MDSRVGCTIGCHPHFACDMDTKAWSQLDRIFSMSHPDFPVPPIGLGELGLDFSHKNHVDIQTQKRVFIKQLELGKKYSVPIVIHLRDSYGLGLDILKSTINSLHPMHIHCFSDNVETAFKFINAFPNAKLGITGLVTYKNPVFIKEVVRRVSVSKLILETDAPFFPVVHDRLVHISLPSDIDIIAKSIADIKNISVDYVLQQNIINCGEVYSKFFDRLSA